MPICIVPPRQALARDAAKRLEALESMEELGAGFVLATHDLEIRGAGELLGEQQSGQMTEVGLRCTSTCSSRPSQALKEGREPALDQPLAAATEVELRLPAFLPEVYVATCTCAWRSTSASPRPRRAALDELTAEMIRSFRSAAAAGAEPAAAGEAQAGGARARRAPPGPRAAREVR